MKTERVLTAVLAVTAMGVLPTALAQQSGNTAANAQEQPSVWQVINGRQNLTTFRSIITRGDIQERLRDDGWLTANITVFAPTNAAFAAIPADQLQALLNDSSALHRVLNYHFVSGYLPGSQLRQRSDLTSVEGSRLQLMTQNNRIRVNGANVTNVNIAASNGWVHVIDRVLIPPDVNLARLARDYRAQSGLPLTQQPSQGQEVQPPMAVPATPGATVPPAPGTAQQNTAQQDTMQMSVAQVIERDATFSRFRDLLTAAGVTGTFQSGGPYTVFAPSNAAFERLSQEQLNALMNDRQRLNALINRHVVRGNLMAERIRGSQALDSAAGASLNVSTQGDRVRVENATITRADIRTNNGVIHEIDRLLLPE